MSGNERVLFLIPAYNEASTVVDVLQRALLVADLLVVVDDGSRDASAKLLAAFALEHPQLTVLTHRENKGMSGALLSGFVYVMELEMAGAADGNDIVVMLDADRQHRPEEAAAAVEALKQGRLDILLGRRDLSGYPIAKRIGNPALSLWASLLSGRRYADVECGFRVMRVSAIARVLPYFSGRRYGCAQELAVISARIGLKVENTFPTTIEIYRKGARLRDGFNNMRMGLVALWRVVRRRAQTFEELKVRAQYAVTIQGTMRQRIPS